MAELLIGDEEEEEGEVFGGESVDGEDLEESEEVLESPKKKEKRQIFKKDDGKLFVEIKIYKKFGKIGKLWKFLKIPGNSRKSINKS